MLDQAKAAVPGKHALAVGYLRRSGVSEVSVQPWTAAALPGRPDSAAADGVAAGNTAGLLGVFAAGHSYALSPRLAGDLERDADALSGLWQRDQAVYRAELTRLVSRHITAHGNQEPQSGNPPSPGPEPDGTGGDVYQVGGAGQARVHARAVRAAAAEAADTLYRLGVQEHAPSAADAPAGPRPVRAARIGVFLRQEAR